MDSRMDPKGRGNKTLTARVLHVVLPQASGPSHQLVHQVTIDKVRGCP